MRKLLPFTFLSLFLTIIPTLSPQKELYLCQRRCKGNYNKCLKAAGGDAAQREACDKSFDKCMYACDPKIRINNKNIN